MLTVIDLSSDILLRHSQGRDELVTQQAERIRRSARALTIVQDILDVAKLEFGKFAVKTKPESMKGLFADALDIMQPSVEIKKIRLSSELPFDDAQVLCDRGRILQVLANLLENAVRYTPENGSVVLKASLESERARISVADSGVGIPESKIPHLFERFWQSDSTNKGTGLGLYIANEIMKFHGSEITVESTLGHGSNFSFTLTHLLAL